MVFVFLDSANDPPVNASPDDLKSLINQGMKAFVAGDRVAAQYAFKHAHDIDPTNLTANYYLAAIAEDNDDAPEAIRYYETVLEHDPSVRQAYFQLANAYHILDRKWQALSVFRRAEKQFPQDREILFYRGQLAARTLPGWHLPMLADKARNDAYETAINAKVKPGDIVLDIGTGSGLLAMMAARAGAAHVYACETEEFMAELAREIIALNGYQDRVTVIGKHSSMLVVGEDLPRKADVLISEVFDRALVGEGVLPTFQHAWMELLAEDARIIPEGATLFGALVECPHLQRFHHIETSNGFDLSPMNALAEPLTYKDALISLEESDHHRVLSEAFTINVFNFRTAPKLIFRSKSPVKLVKSGRADSILMWFDLNLAPGVVFSTRDTKLHDHWRQASQVLLDPVECQAGQAFMLSTEYRNYFDFMLQAENATDMY